MINMNICYSLKELDVKYFSYRVALQVKCIFHDIIPLLIYRGNIKDVFFHQTIWHIFSPVMLNDKELQTKQQVIEKKYSSFSYFYHIF